MTISPALPISARAPLLTAREYEEFYRHHPRIHQATDNSMACIEKLTADTVGQSVCDVGCGTGYLLERIYDVCPETHRLTGTDFVFDNSHLPRGIEFVVAKIEVCHS